MSIVHVSICIVHYTLFDGISCFYSNDIEQDPAHSIQHRNGYLFEQRMTQRSVEQAAHSYLVQELLNVNQYQQFPCFPVGGHLQFLPSGRPCRPAESTSSCGSLPSESTEAKSKRCSWSNPEVKCLISAYKQHQNSLKATRSAHGKKSVWESIMDEFIQLCREAGIDTSKTLMQIKEKWRGIFDKYKSASDNNNRTGRDRKTCEFYDDIHEFMASSDKVNPKFVRENNVASQKRKDSEEVSAGEEGDCAATTADPITDTEPGEDDNTKIKQPNEKKTPSGLQRKKQKTSSIDSTDTENAMLHMFQAQQEAFQRLEEKDERMLQAMMKSQEDAHRRHEEFTVAVLAKLGDIFASEK